MTLDEMSLFDGAPFPKPKADTVKPKTNADKIRAMTDEELAEFLDKDASYTCLICARRDAKDSCGDYECKNVVLEWLRKEAEDVGTD